MDRSERRSTLPQRPLQVQVTWTVEDTPERHAAWRRLWRYILDRVNSGAQTERISQMGEGGRTDDALEDLSP
jgi:hypothetical protein